MKKQSILEIGLNLPERLIKGDIVKKSYARVGNMIHPISAMLHYQVALESERFSPQSVIDIGGVGKLSKFLSCEIVNANKNQGFDGTNLPHDDNSFDVSVSVATLEHVKDQEKYIAESIRVCTKSAIHWFPCGEGGLVAEKYKGSIAKYNHPCVIPDISVLKIPNSRSYDYMTVAEHMLLLCSLYETMNCIETYDFIDEHGHKTYGKMLIIDKQKSCGEKERKN